MATMPNLGVDNDDVSSVLNEIDPLFSAPIGPSPAVKAPSAPAARKPILPALGLTPEQEQYAAAGAGAIAGPAVQSAAARVFPSKEARTAEAVKTLKQENDLQRLMRNMREEELLRRGVSPSDLQKSQTSGTKWMQNWAGIDKEIAGGVPQASAQYNRMKGQGPVTSRMTKMFGPSPAGEPGQPKVPLLDRLAQQSAEASKAAEASKSAESAAAAATQSRLGAAMPGVGSMAAKVLTSPAVQGPLAGAAAGLNFHEAYQRFVEGDRSGAVISALGGIGAVMSMFPGLGLAGAGLSLATIPAQYINDGLKNPEAQQNPHGKAMDPMGALTGYSGE